MPVRCEDVAEASRLRSDTLTDVVRGNNANQRETSPHRYGSRITQSGRLKYARPVICLKNYEHNGKIEKDGLLTKICRLLLVTVDLGFYLIRGLLVRKFEARGR